MSTWSDYVEQTAGTSNQSEIARKAGVSQASVSRWFDGSTPSPAHAALFAQKYDRNVLEAFVAAGFLTQSEAGTPPPPRPPSPAVFSSMDLVHELRLRLDPEHEEGRITDEDMAEVHLMFDRTSEEADTSVDDELAAVASEDELEEPGENET